MDQPLDAHRLRRLRFDDAPLVVAATRDETAAALWGPRPAGPYRRCDAERALREWTPEQRQVSYGVIAEEQLLAAFGVMLDADGGAELCYWVPPAHRGQGLATRGLAAVTDWAHRAGLKRLWLEIAPGNALSQRVADRAGFAYECIHGEATRDVHLIYNHTVEY